jgi:hypothetical protein
MEGASVVETVDHGEAAVSVVLAVTCACGCGRATRSRYAWGHNLRGKTNAAARNSIRRAMETNAEFRARVEASRARAATRKRRAKLTPEAVGEIRRRAAAGENPKAFAPEYGVHWRTVYDITEGKTWSGRSSS